MGSVSSFEKDAHKDKCWKPSEAFYVKSMILVKSCGGNNAGYGLMLTPG